MATKKVQNPKEIKHIGVPPGVRGQITLPESSVNVPANAKRNRVAKKP